MWWDRSQAWPCGSCRKGLPIEADELQHNLEIGEVELALDVVGVQGNDVAVREFRGRSARFPQVFVEIGLLAREVETEPIHEGLVVQVAECAVGSVLSQAVAECGVKVASAGAVAQRTHIGEAAEERRDVRDNSSTQRRGRAAGRIRC